MDALLTRLLLFRPEGGGEGAGAGGGGEGAGGEPAGGEPKDGKDDKGEQTVPRSRLKQEADARAAAERERDDFKKRLEDQEAKDLSDKEKAERQAAAEKERADAAEQRATRLEREAWVRDAATTANFISPADAIAHIDVLELAADGKTPKLGTPEEAKAAVDQLAKDNKHLVGQGTRQNVGRPGGGTAAGGGGKQDEIPVDAEGKPDVKRGLGQDLLSHLAGGRTSS